MKVLLEGLLPRLVPSLAFVCVAHSGKQDLEKSIPRKLRAWKEPGVRFMIVRDNDRGDCHQLKRKLALMCQQAGRPDTMVRIPCQELEAWYLGEPEALAKAYENPRLVKILESEKRLADSDSTFQKISGARRMGELLSDTGNCSRSFQVFLTGTRKLAASLASTSAGEQLEIFDQE